MKFFGQALGVLFFTFVLAFTLIAVNAKCNLDVNRYTNKEIASYMDSLSTVYVNKVDSLVLKINSLENVNKNLSKEIEHSRKEHQSMEERIKKIESICRKIDSDMDVFD